MAIASLDEAVRVAGQISELTRKVRGVPGLDEGHVERLHSSLLARIRDYGKRPWWHHRFLVRELDGIAIEVKGLATRGSLSREHMEIFDLALYRLKQRRFRTAGKTLQRLDESVSLVREREQLRENYRPFRKRLAEESKAVEEEILRLQNVPVPEASPSDMVTVERQIESFNAASAKAMGRFLTHAPGRDVIRVCLRAGPLPGLHLPTSSDPEAARELLRLLEGREDELARTDLNELIEASGYSEARFAHLAPGSGRLHHLLQSNVSWLQSISRAAGAVDISLRDPPEMFQQRISSLLTYLAEVPGAEESVQHLRALRALAETGRLAAIRRSAQVYRDHGEAARKRWDGTLESEIKQKREVLERLRSDLRGLPEQ